MVKRPVSIGWKELLFLLYILYIYIIYIYIYIYILYRYTVFGVNFRIFFRHREFGSLSFPVEVGCRRIVLLTARLILNMGGISTTCLLGGKSLFNIFVFYILLCASFGILFPMWNFGRFPCGNQLHYSELD